MARLRQGSVRVTAQDVARAVRQLETARAGGLAVDNVDSRVVFAFILHLDNCKILHARESTVLKVNWRIGAFAKQRWDVRTVQKRHIPEDMTAKLAVPRLTKLDVRIDGTILEHAVPCPAG